MLNNTRNSLEIVGKVYFMHTLADTVMVVKGSLFNSCEKILDKKCKLLISTILCMKRTQELGSKLMSAQAWR